MVFLCNCLLFLSMFKNKCKNNFLLLCVGSRVISMSSIWPQKSYFNCCQCNDRYDSSCSSQFFISILSSLGYGLNQVIVKCSHKILENASLWKERKKMRLTYFLPWELLGGLGLIWIFPIMCVALFTSGVEFCKSRWHSQGVSLFSHC